DDVDPALQLGDEVEGRTLTLVRLRDERQRGRQAQAGGVYLEGVAGGGAELRQRVAEAPLPVGERRRQDEAQAGDPEQAMPEAPRRALRSHGGKLTPAFLRPPDTRRAGGGGRSGAGGRLAPWSLPCEVPRRTGASWRTRTSWPCPASAARSGSWRTGSGRGRCSRPTSTS